MMLLGTLTACAGAPIVDPTKPAPSGNQEQQTTPPDNQPDDQTEPSQDEELPYHKIGFICWSYTGNLEMSYKAAMEKLAAGLNFDVEFAEASSNEDVLAAIENLIENGCEGIIATAVPPTVMELCSQNGVYFAQYSNNVDEETQVEFEKSEYWLGYIANNDYEASYNGIKTLYDQGCREVGLMTVPPGLQDNHDKRFAGAVAACEDLGIAYHEYRGIDFLDAVENFCTLYPDLDGIFSTFASSGALDAFIQALDSCGRPDVKFATVDIADTAAMYIEEGRLGFAAGGQFPDCELCVALMLNALNGGRLGGGPVYAVSSFLEIASVEDMDNYNTYICGDVPPYTADEIKALLTTVNPDATPEDIQNLAESYSIANIMERHKDLF